MHRRKLTSCHASFLQNLYAGKRSFDTAITAEDRQYQTIRRPYGFRKIDTIKSGSTMTDSVGALMEEIRRYAGNRAQDVTRGAETPALAFATSRAVRSSPPARTPGPAARRPTAPPARASTSAATSARSTRSTAASLPVLVGGSDRRPPVFFPPRH